MKVRNCTLIYPVFVSLLERTIDMPDIEGINNSRTILFMIFHWYRVYNLELVLENVTY
jgi:hypothetical protein